jgi:hypothetical protein
VTKKNYPLRDEDGEPIGSTDTLATNARALLVSGGATDADGNVTLKVDATSDGSLTRAHGVLDRLDQLIDSNKRIEFYLALIANEQPGEDNGFD